MNPFRVALLALLVAFSWHSLLTQTHRHFGTGALPAAWTGATAATPDEPDRKAPSGHPDDCSICRQAAHAAQFLLPPAIDFEAPARNVFRPGTAASPDGVLARRSHRWQSRAPPFPLQA